MSKPNPSEELKVADYREVIADDIVHFDATGPRREAMRQRASHTGDNTSHKTNGSSSTSSHAPGSTSVSKSDTNGNGKKANPATTNKVDRWSESASNTQTPSSINAWKSRVETSTSTGGKPIEPLAAPITNATPKTYSAAPTPPPTAPSPTTPLVTQTVTANSPVATSGISRAALQKFLIDFVMEQTGYPEDVVSLDADLEADLGIDSIKIAQMLGEVIEQFKIDMKLMQGTAMEDYKSLGTIIEKLVEITSTSASTMAPVSPPKETVAQQESNQPPNAVSPPLLAKNVEVNSHVESVSRREQMIKFLVDFVIEQTGYPEDIVTVDADLEADLGIDSIKVAQMMGELNDYFRLNVAALRDQSADSFKTIASIVEIVIAVDHQQTVHAPETSIPKATLVTPVASHIASPTPNGSRVAPTPTTSSHVSKTQVLESAEEHSNAGELDAHALKKFLVDFVIEQTGYPEDVVTLDADLEADLGIDSIKVAQMMGEMNDHFGLTLSHYKGRTMDDFKSLDAIISHLTRKN